jgi:hypothetical protein
MPPRRWGNYEVLDRKPLIQLYGAYFGIAPPFSLTTYLNVFALNFFGIGLALLRVGWMH